MLDRIVHQEIELQCRGQFPARAPVRDHGRQGKALRGEPALRLALHGVAGGGRALRYEERVPAVTDGPLVDAGDQVRFERLERGPEVLGRLDRAPDAALHTRGRRTGRRVWLRQAQPADRRPGQQPPGNGTVRSREVREHSVEVERYAHGVALPGRAGLRRGAR